MERMLHIGPLALPWAALLLAVSWVFGAALHERMARHCGLKAGARHSWLAGLSALLMARVGYVLNHATEYGITPWSALDIRDGGWAPWWGVSAVLAYLVFLWSARSPWRKTATLGAICGLAFWISSTLALQDVAASSPMARRSQLPTWGAVALDNSHVSLPALQGQPVVINLWATWCPPCRREMPVLRRAREQHPQIRFLWVNQGEAQEIAARYAAQQGLPPADVLLDTDSELGRMLRTSALPTTLFFNAEGTLVTTRTGELSSATLADRLTLITRGN